MNDSRDPRSVTANTWEPGTGGQSLRLQPVFQLSTGGSYYRLGNYNEMAAAPLTVCASQNTTLDVFPVYTAYDKSHNQLGTGQAATITNP